MSKKKFLFNLLLVSIASFIWITNISASSNGEGIQIYQKNIHLIPEHKQKLADDITRYRNADNLWDVLRDEFSLIHYENHPAVQAKIEWFMNNQDFVLRSATRAAPYLYYILQQVRKRHLPAELVLLPIIESGYNPFNRSPVGAVGIWQLMPATAADRGIKRNGWYDGRRDVIASTRAALNYLAYLQTFFEGNWLYAIAAYNTGEGNVQSAIKRNIRDGRDISFWSLPLAQQTKDYVPSLLALAIIISHPDQYPIYLPPVRNAPYLAEIDVGREIHLQYAATLAGLSFKKILQLNPAFNHTANSTPKKGPKKLVLPIENVEQFTENLSRSPIKPKLDWLHYKAKSGDTLASISKKFMTDQNEIKKLNRLTKNNVKAGANLIIPNKGQGFPEDNEYDEMVASQNVQQQKAEDVLILAEKEEPPEEIISVNAFDRETGKYVLQPGDTIYMVRSQDNIENIAQRFRISSKAVRDANELKNKKLEPGKQIIIPTHLASLNKLQPGDTLYMVRKGDTIDKIARKFNTTPGAIRLANLVDDNSLMVGEKLVVPTHIRG